MSKSPEELKQNAVNYIERFLKKHEGKSFASLFSSSEKKMEISIIAVPTDVEESVEESSNLLGPFLEELSLMRLWTYFPQLESICPRCKEKGKEVKLRKLPDDRTICPMCTIVTIQ